MRTFDAPLARARKNCGLFGAVAIDHSLLLRNSVRCADWRSAAALAPGWMAPAWITIGLSGLPEVCSAKRVPPNAITSSLSGPKPIRKAEPGSARANDRPSHSIGMASLQLSPP